MSDVAEEWIDCPIDVFFAWYSDQPKPAEKLTHIYHRYTKLAYLVFVNIVTIKAILVIASVQHYDGLPAARRLPSATSFSISLDHCPKQRPDGDYYTWIGRGRVWLGDDAVNSWFGDYNKQVSDPSLQFGSADCVPEDHPKDPSHRCLPTAVTAINEKSSVHDMSKLLETLRDGTACSSSGLLKTPLVLQCSNYLEKSLSTLFMQTLAWFIIGLNVLTNMQNYILVHYLSWHDPQGAYSNGLAVLLAFFLYILTPVSIMGSCLTLVLDAQDDISIMSNCIGLVLLLRLKDIMQFVFSPTVKQFRMPMQGNRNEMETIQRRFATMYSIPFWIPLLAAFQIWCLCTFLRKTNMQINFGGFSADSEDRALSVAIFHFVAGMEADYLWTLAVFALLIIYAQMHKGEVKTAADAGRRQGRRLSAYILGPDAAEIATAAPDEETPLLPGTFNSEETPLLEDDRSEEQ